MRIKGLILALGLMGSAMMAWGPGAAAAATGSLYQQLVVRWSHDDFRGHDRASFQIPGIGNGNVMCSPTTTWIQMVPANPGAENDFWAVLSQTKNGHFETAVRDARVYRYSTPTAPRPHGTGNSAYLGLNTSTPIEANDSGSLVGLISRRNGLTSAAGSGSSPTSVHLSWSWSDFGTAHAQCQVSATFLTEIGGRSRRIAEGVREGLPQASDIGPVSAFNINWSGESDYSPSLRWPSSLAVPEDGTLTGRCQPGTAGAHDLTLTPANGSDPYAEVTTFQGEGVENSQTDDYYTDPESGQLGPIPLPVNGFIEATILPAWNASGTEQTQLLISSLRKVNDPNGADDLCEVAVQAISAPNPLF